LQGCIHITTELNWILTEYSAKAELNISLMPNFVKQNSVICEPATNGRLIAFLINHYTAQ
jgi:hypothetical protein